MNKEELRKKLEERLLKVTHAWQEIPYIVDAAMQVFEEYEKEKVKSSS